MGGDDLNDELLWTTEPVVETQHHDDSSSDSDDSPTDDHHDEEASSSPTKDPNSGQQASSTTTSSNKRKSSAVKEKNQKKRKQQQSTPEQLLLQASRDLVGQDCAQQAAFLTMALRHYTLMEQQQRKHEEEVDNVAKMEILPSYLVGRNREEPLEESRGGPLILERIRQAVSVPKMKKWKHVGSPCVVRSLICINCMP